MNRQPIVVQKITALYSRLSRDDERAGERLSIEHPKFILEDYAKKQGFTNLVHYTDDGFSGSDFSRPDWKRMIADVEADKVGAVICKDEYVKQKLKKHYQTRINTTQANHRHSGHNHDRYACLGYSPSVKSCTFQRISSRSPGNTNTLSIKASITSRWERDSAATVLASATALSRLCLSHSPCRSKVSPPQ